MYHVCEFIYKPFLAHGVKFVFNLNTTILAVIIIIIIIGNQVPRAIKKVVTASLVN